MCNYQILETLEGKRRRRCSPVQCQCQASGGGPGLQALVDGHSKQWYTCGVSKVTQPFNFHQGIRKNSRTNECGEANSK